MTRTHFGRKLFFFGSISKLICNEIYGSVSLGRDKNTLMEKIRVIVFITEVIVVDFTGKSSQ